MLLDSRFFKILHHVSHFMLLVISIAGSSTAWSEIQIGTALPPRLPMCHMSPPVENSSELVNAVSQSQ
jgi:hypothetical protein